MEKFSENIDFGTISKFKDLFDAINSQKLGQEYRDAYEESVQIAKDLVKAKTKAGWDGDQFKKSIAERYPSLSPEFVSALRQCVENYNPPVNLPDQPLW